MARHMQLREFLLGVEGLALLRGLFSGSVEDARARIEEIRTILAEGGDEAIAVPTLEVLEGYERWATTYDAPGNPLVSAEQPAVWELLERADPGRALDAACGTGRHTHRLVELGHEVVGVDATRSMLKAARRKVPGAEFVQGDLGHLPFDDDSFDLAVCALALEHLKDLVPPVAELTRVLRTGGALIISESHPALRAIGGAPYFEDSVGASGVVRSYKHGHADYLAAFAAAGLALGRCIEIPFSAEQVAMQRPAVTFSPQATEAAFLGFPAVLIWELTVAAEELPALRVAAGELDGIADRLRAAGVDLVWDESLPGERRFHARDPWGNRIELLSRGPGETPGRAP